MSIVEVKLWLPDKWDYEADVVIVGFGGAGAAAAITAHDEGATVLPRSVINIQDLARLGDRAE